MAERVSGERELWGDIHNATGGRRISGRVGIDRTAGEQYFHQALPHEGIVSVTREEMRPSNVWVN